MLAQSLALQMRSSMSINWVLEREVFNDIHDRLTEAPNTAGHRVIQWDDFWWETGNWPSLENGYTIFHGSLGNASRIASELPWQPGVFCNTSAFACRAWYEKVKKWLIRKEWVFTNVAEIGSPKSFFVRPDSPLKPFSGRVVKRDEISFEALDYGFYYDDKNLPIVITPVTEIEMEWRFVIAGRKAIASSAYDASDRTETNSGSSTEIISFVEEVANALVPPDPIYILDVCRSRGKIKLVEINPFSGADLYACDRKAIISAVEVILMACDGQQKRGADGV